MSGSGSGKQTVILNPASGSTTIAANKSYFIAVAPGTISGLSVKCYTSASEYYELTSKTGGEFTFVRSKYYDLGSTSGWTKHTLSTGGYSVSDTKKVMFTTGNLYWDGSDYHIESTQTGSSRNAAGNPTLNTTDHMSYFYWTNYTDYTSGNSDYMPYKKNFASGTLDINDEFWCGITHPLTVDGTSNLYVLTNDEWNYLIKYRTNADKLYKYNVNVTDGDGNEYSNCLIIAPDAYDYTTNPLQDTYTLDQISTLKLTCLPRVGCWFSDYQKLLQTTYGCYWSSTPNDEDPDGDGNYNGFDFYWTDGDISTITGNSIERRSYAHCIRLVYTYTGE